MSVPTLGLTSVAAAATMKMTTSINITNASQVKAKKIFAKPRTKSTFAYKTTFARKAAMRGTNETTTTSVSVQNPDTTTAMVFVARLKLSTTRTVSVLTSATTNSSLVTLNYIRIAKSLTTKSLRAYAVKRTQKISTSTMTRDFAAHKTTTTQMAFVVWEEVKTTAIGMLTLEATAVHLASAGRMVNAQKIAMSSVNTKSKISMTILENANARKVRS